MAEIPGTLLVHRVTVRTLQGSGSLGDVLAEPVEVRCWRDARTRLVRSPAGDEVVSQTRLLVRLTDGPKFTERSEVTIPNGAGGTTTTYVLGSAPNDDRGLGAWQHATVDLA